jgi:nitrogen regulatory protein PII
MKSVFIIYAPALESKVFDAVDRMSIKQYTKMTYLHGVGGHSEPHLDSQVWPGSNMALMIVTEEKVKDQLLKEMKAIKESSIEEGLKVFVFPVEEVI